MKGSKVLGRAGVWLAAAAMLPVPLWSFGAAAQSNTAAPQSTPGLDRFNLPPSTRATPVPVPTSGPIIAPLRPTPTPTPSILRIPTPTATASATPTARPTATPSVQRPATNAAQPAPAPAAQPTTTAPIPQTVETPAPVASATPQPAASPAAPEQPSSGLSTGTLIAIGAILLVLVAAGGFLLGRWRRVREEDVVDEVSPAPPVVAPEPVAAAPEADRGGRVTVPARRAAADEPQPRLEITLIPKRAGTNLLSAAVDYRVIVRNTGPVAARDVRFAMYMLTASARQAQDLQMVFTAAIEQPMVAPFELAPGQDIDLSGIAMLPRDNINVMTIDGKPWFVPVLAMKAEYRWGENVGAPGIATAAHMIGIDRGEGAKMAPFRLDGGPHMHPEVAERKVA